MGTLSSVLLRHAPRVTWRQPLDEEVRDSFPVAERRQHRHHRDRSSDAPTLVFFTAGASRVASSGWAFYGYVFSTFDIKEFDMQS